MSPPASDSGAGARQRNSSAETISNYVQRTAESTYHVPSPPRIVIPPAAAPIPIFPSERAAHAEAEEAEAKRVLTLDALPSLPFVPSIDYNKLIRGEGAGNTGEWRYEQRRDAQMILPYLYLGPMSAARDEAWLAREGITCVLGIRQCGTAVNNHASALGGAVAMVESKHMIGAMRTAERLGIERHTVDIASHQDLISRFPRTTALMLEHLSEISGRGGKGKVLVFCESGNERSAGVVCAFLLDVYPGLGFIVAIQICQAQRFCVNFDEPMKRVLQAYADIVAARRVVDDSSCSGDGHGAGEITQWTPGLANGGMGGLLPSRHTNKNKRALQREIEDEDGDEVMTDVQADDLERFGSGRRPWTPFVDSGRRQGHRYEILNDGNA